MSGSMNPVLDAIDEVKGPSQAEMLAAFQAAKQPSRAPEGAREKPNAKLVLDLFTDEDDDTDEIPCVRINGWAFEICSPQKLGSFEGLRLGKVLAGFDAITERIRAAPDFATIEDADIDALEAKTLAYLQRMLRPVDPETPPGLIAALGPDKRDQLMRVFFETQRSQPSPSSPSASPASKRSRGSSASMAATPADGTGSRSAPS